MGNMLMNKRVEESIRGEKAPEKEEHRIFPEHMYNGPLKLGDPMHRGMSKMEMDPMIPQRMRDESRTALCHDWHQKFIECAKDSKLAIVYKCRTQRDDLAGCMEGYLKDDVFKQGLIEEYLNERSHFRQTGHRTRRYRRNGHFLQRSEEEYPVFDENGRYRPRKPDKWDESYKDGKLPEWAKNANYS